jgi:epoxyqueuosine reductase
LIKNEAYRLGFDFVGIAKARRLDEDASRLEKWLKTDYNGKMGYMNNHFEKRVDPTRLVEGSKSVVSLLYNYHTKDKQQDPEAPKLAKYAYGVDYHFVVKDKLKELFQFIQDEIGEVGGRVFVDSAPVLDRAWARESGLGWIGKNSMLINKERGSDFFIAELILDLDLTYDQPIPDYCGTCTKCLDACPTEAILPDRQIDSNRCISYLTIELKDEKLPSEFQDQMNNWAFGCDICQDVCPWNRFAIEIKEPYFQPNEELMKLSDRDWFEMEKERFNRLFKKSAVKRTKFSGLKRNLNFLKKE